MTKLVSLLAVSLALGAAGRPALAQEPPPPPPPEDPNAPPAPAEVAEGYDPEQLNPPPPAEAGASAPIPSYAEGAPIPYVNAGNYCYVGPHPADPRAGGGDWDPTEGAHVRNYPPVDLRLFVFRDGCYYFTGDPTDFGYTGQTYAYYGAHPVLDAYGGGWCFMVGGHTHLWRPWSPYFVVTGNWYYWRGAYDSFFWSYWPYYSFYYRNYYPRYYGGGRYWRSHSYHAAPPIRYVPRAQGGYAGSPRHGGQAASPGWHGGSGSTWRGTPTAPVQTQAPAWRAAPSTGNGWGARPPASPSVWRAVAPPSPAPSPSFRPSYRAPSAPAFHPAPSHSGTVHSGGWHRR